MIYFVGEEERGRGEEGGAVEEELCRKRYVSYLRFFFFLFFSLFFSFSFSLSFFVVGFL